MMALEQVLPLQISVDLGIMVMNKYFTFPKASELKPHHQK